MNLDHIESLLKQADKITDCIGLAEFKNMISEMFASLLAQNQLTLDLLGPLNIDPADLVDLGAVIAWITSVIDLIKAQFDAATALAAELAARQAEIMPIINNLNVSLKCNL